MFDPQMALLSKFLEAVLADLATDPGSAEPWNRAQQALATTRTKEPEIAALVDARDAVGLRLLVDQWTSGARHLPEQDREVLKRAGKAFRKSMKVTRLHDESGLTRNPMTRGQRSSILGITPPPRYPQEVWEELARQGRLIQSKHGIYELPPE
jgi:hypothetical protein